MTTRREFLTSLAAVHLAGLKMTVPFSTIVEYAPTIPPPYGPAERTAAIDAAAQLVDETIIALEKFWGFLLATRALPPSEVDGCKWFELEYAAMDAETKLDSAIQCSGKFEDALEAATGKRAYYWCLKSDIMGNEKPDRDFIQVEIDAFREDAPEVAAELQALLNARLGVL